MTKQKVRLRMTISAKPSPDIIHSQLEIVEKSVRKAVSDPEMCFSILGTIRDYVTAAVEAGDYEKALEYLQEQEDDWREFMFTRQQELRRQQLKEVAISVGTSILTGAVGATVTKLF